MISVCMATYNGARYLNAQLDSILKQLSSQDEVVISDDGSTDDTLDIIRSYNDYRIKLVHNSGRKGVVGNFENALANAKGDFIFLSDQDDIWHDNKVEVVMCALKDSQLVVHNAQLVDENEVPFGYDYFHVRGVRKGFWNILMKNRFLGCCMAFNRTMLKYILPFPRSIQWHDMWIALVVQMYHDVSLLHENLISYRRHDGNLSTTAFKSKFSLLFMIKYRLVFIGQCINRYVNMRIKKPR